MTRPTGPMIAGDFLVHLQVNGKVALHDIQTWREPSEPLRFFATLADAKEFLRTDRSGIKIWYCHWKAPKRITPFL